MQRFTADFPCRICAGWERMPRGQGSRCFGFLGSDTEYCHCTNDLYAGNLEPHIGTNGGETYAHRLKGACRCGSVHGAGESNPGQWPAAHPAPMTNGKTNGAVHRSPAPSSPVSPIRDANSTPLAEPTAIPKVVAEYDYVRPDGTLAFKVCRLEPGPNGKAKSFFQVQADGTRGLGGVSDADKALLYRANQALKESTGPIYFCEGEKDVNAMWASGYPAVCNLGGSGQGMKPESAEQLRGRDVIIVQDDDEPGWKHAERVKERLRNVVRSVAIVRARKGKDASDHLQAGFGADAFVTVEPAILNLPPPTAAEPELSALDRAFLPENMTIAGWAAEKRVPLDWIVDDLILAKKTMLLAGAGGAGKGHLWLQLVLAIATGQAFGSFAVGRARRVLILSLEDTRDDLRDRYQSAIDARWLAASSKAEAIPLLERNVMIVNLVGVKGGFLSEEFCDRVAAVAAREGGFDLVLIDPMTRAVPQNEDVTLNSQEGAGVVLTRLDQIGTLTGSAVLCVHHSNKASRTKLADALSVNAVSGSAQLTDLARMVLMVAELSPLDVLEYGLDPHSSYCAMAVAKNNFAPRPKKISGWRRIAGGALTECDIAAVPAEANEEKALQILRELGAADAQVWLSACMEDGPRKLSQRCAKAAIKALELSSRVMTEMVGGRLGGPPKRVFSAVEDTPDLQGAPALDRSGTEPA
jgi:RecA-family ATPase